MKTLRGAASLGSRLLTTEHLVPLITGDAMSGLKQCLFLTAAFFLTACSGPAAPVEPARAYLTILNQTGNQCEVLKFSSPSGSLSDTLGIASQNGTPRFLAHPNNDLTIPFNLTGIDEASATINPTSTEVVLDVQCVQAGAARPVATLRYTYVQGRSQRLTIQSDAGAAQGVLLTLSEIAMPG